jgi:hypothetical protein
VKEGKVTEDDYELDLETAKAVIEGIGQEKNDLYNELAGQREKYKKLEDKERKRLESLEIAKDNVECANKRRQEAEGKLKLRDEMLEVLREALRVIGIQADIFKKR